MLIPLLCVTEVIYPNLISSVFIHEKLHSVLWSSITTKKSPFTSCNCFLCDNNHNLRLARGNRSGSVAHNLGDFNSTSGDYASHTIWAKMVYRLLPYLGFRKQDVKTEEKVQKSSFFSLNMFFFLISAVIWMCHSMWDTLMCSALGLHQK